MFRSCGVGIVSRRARVFLSSRGVLEVGHVRPLDRPPSVDNKKERRKEGGVMEAGSGTKKGHQKQ